MVNRDKEIPFTRVWVLVLLDIVTMNVTILAKEQRWKKSKRKIREAIDRNNKKEANIIIIIITIVELPSVG